MAQLRLAGTVPESIVDGPSIRYTVFVQGCPHACAGCHNPQTHPFEGGTQIEVKDLFADITKRSFVKAVTFSGGEPFCQPEALWELAVGLRARGFDVMAYSGYTFEQLCALQNPMVDCLLSQISLLVDGKFEQDKRDITLQFRGSSNQRVIDVPASLVQKKAVLHPKYN